MRRITFFILITLCYTVSLGQNHIYHGNNRLTLNQPLSTYQKGDTLRTFDSLRKMYISGIFSSTKLVNSLELHYSDSSGIRRIDVFGVIKDTNLYWNGKCVETDFSSKHSIVTFFTMNKFEGVITYFVRDQIQSIESIKKDNISIVGINYQSGKPSYYWLKDTINREDGSNISFHENGEVKSFGHYQNGARVGEWFYYDEEGIMLLKEYYKNGVLVRSKKQRIKKR